MPSQWLPVHHGLHRWATLRDKVTHICAIPRSPNRFVEHLVAYKEYALPVLGFVGSLAAPDQATVTDESRALQRMAAGPCDSISTKVGLGIGVSGIPRDSLAARFLLASCFEHTFRKCWRNFRQPAAACSPHSMCGGVVFDQGAQLLSGSARACYPRH